MKQYNGEKYIISFTSFGSRFKTVGAMIYSLLIQSFRNTHICMTVFKDDIKDLTEDIKLLINKDVIELIVADKNLCPHLKYYYAMKKYHNLPIITVDDDRIYTSNTISMLIKKYETLTYKSVISTCAPKMIERNGVVMPDSLWCVGNRRMMPGEKSYIGMAEGFGGVLYPSNCFSNLDKRLDDIYACLYHDDLLLKVFEIEDGIPVTQIDGVYGVDVEGIEQNLISSRIKNHHNTGDTYRDEMVARFNSRLLKAFHIHN